MAGETLQGMKVAILVTDGFDWGQSLPVDLKLDDARPQDFDALLLLAGARGRRQAA